MLIPIKIVKLHIPTGVCGRSASEHLASGGGLSLFFDDRTGIITASVEGKPRDYISPGLWRSATEDPEKEPKK